MATERVRRQIDRLLDEAEEALARLDWAVVRARARAVLALDAGNADAAAYLAAAERELVSSERSDRPPLAGPDAGTVAPSDAVKPLSQRERERAQSTSFASGRYAVKRFLGEGGKKRVYLAHHAQLDRDVACALIKTKGLDPSTSSGQAALARITREAQAMGCLGDLPTSSPSTTSALNPRLHTGGTVRVPYVTLSAAKGPARSWVHRLGPG